MSGYVEGHQREGGAVLRESTGDRVADKIVEGVIGIFGQVYPDRVRSYYLRGSYATGAWTAGSDLDMFIVFAGRMERAEAVRARRLAGHCALLSPKVLEIIVVGEHQLGMEVNVVVALNLKLATRLVHGEDIRDGLPEFQADRYVREIVHTPYHTYVLPSQRRDHAVLAYPLRHLDPDGEFYGFDEWPVPDQDGGDSSTKLLVSTVCWTATALVALRAGVYVGDKTAAVGLYRRHVADEWTDLVTDVHEWCRNRWRYRVPSAEADRRRLREWCDRALAFQNHLLGHYRQFQLAELRSGEPERQGLAARRLAQIRFSDPEVAEALRLAGQ
jgi:hypothetical protein